MTMHTARVLGALAFLALSAAAPPAIAFDASGFSAMGGAMPQAQAQWLCVDALRRYNAGGPPPPAMCMDAPATPAFAAPTAPSPAYTTCMPFGNGGQRCTTIAPGAAPVYTTCMPFGLGGQRCTTQ